MSKTTVTCALLGLVVAATPSPAEAQSPPPTLVQQGRVIGPSGPLNTDAGEPLEVLFTLEVDGRAPYAETERLAFRDGYYAAVLGDDPTEGDLRQVIEAGGASVYLTVPTEDGEITFGPTRIHSVPYAFQAAAVDGDVVATSIDFRVGTTSTPLIDGNGDWVSGVACAGCVDSAAIADQGVRADDLAADSVTSAAIASDAVGESELAAGSVTTGAIAVAAVTTNRIANDAISTEKLAGGAVDTTSIADSAVTGPKIATGAVGSSKIAAGAVVSGALADGAVETAKLGNSAVTSSKIADGTIGPADIAGGLYARKGHLNFYTSSVLVTFNKNETSVSCADANDLPVIAVCNPESANNNLRLVQRQISGFDNDVLPATLRCQMENDNPTVGQRFEATIGCISVP